VTFIGFRAHLLLQTILERIAPQRHRLAHLSDARIVQ
jgi:hypothetical protein